MVPSSVIVIAIVFAILGCMPGCKLSVIKLIRCLENTPSRSSFLTLRTFLIKLVDQGAWRIDLLLLCPIVEVLLSYLGFFKLVANELLVVMIVVFSADFVKS
jgi:hypothetical protein